MKKYVVFILVLLLSFTACSAASPVPDSGYWYCDELAMGIDFAVMQTSPVCAKVYDAEGKCKILGCTLGDGNDITVYESVGNSELDIIAGTLKWDGSGNELTIVTFVDGIAYTFVLVEE